MPKIRTKLAIVPILLGLFTLNELHAKDHDKKDPKHYYHQKELKTDLVNNKNLEDDPLLVQTLNGSVYGKEDSFNTYAWLGVPFARPPVGEHRWQPPQNITPWSGIKETTNFYPVCSQLANLDADGDGDNEFVVEGSEDCLALNVWRPKDISNTKKPVMIWIHGGGNVDGGTSDSLYQGANLSSNGDVVLVTVPYRLNLFGFLQNSLIKNGEPLTDSGNFGTLDLIQAITWVQENISSFGGDPSNITLVGESAGGFNIWSLLTSPLAKGKFHKVIIESGCPSFREVEVLEESSQNLLEQLVVADGLATPETAEDYIQNTDPEILKSYLYEKDADSILQVVADSGGFDITNYGPAGDGYVLPENAFNAVFNGEFEHVPTIIGSNSNEMKLFLLPYYNINPVQYNLYLKSVYGDLADEVKSLYPASDYQPQTTYNQFADLADTGLERLCGYYAAWAVSSYQPTWVYSFRYESLLKQPYRYLLGAAHAFEIPFVFGGTENFTELFAKGTKEDRLALSSNMQKYWSCLAHSSTPNCKDALTWDSFDENSNWARMFLDSEQTMEALSQSEWDKTNFSLSFFYPDYPQGP